MCSPLLPKYNSTLNFQRQELCCSFCRNIIYEVVSDLLTKLKLTSFVPGYRHVPLLTKRGDVICSAGLFVHLMLIDNQ